MDASISSRLCESVCPEQNWQSPRLFLARARLIGFIRLNWIFARDKALIEINPNIEGKSDSTLQQPFSASCSLEIPNKFKIASLVSLILITDYIYGKL